MFLFVRCFIHSCLALSQALHLLRRSSLTSVVLDVLVIHAHSIRGLRALSTLNAHGKICSGGAPLECSPQLFYGCGFWVSVFQFCIERSHWEHQFRPLSGIEKRPFLGGWFCTKAVVISICATDFVRCREVVLLSEGPLWEVQLYSLCHQNKCTIIRGKICKQHNHLW